MSLSNQVKGKIPYFWDPLPDLSAQSPRIGFKLPYQVVTNDNYKKFLDDFLASSRVSIDTETTSLEVDIAECVTIQIRTKNFNFIIFVCHELAENLEITKVMLFLNALKDKETIYTFNAFYDFRVLFKNFNINLGEFRSQVVDVSELLFLADTNHPFPNLKDSERFILGVDPPEFEQFLGQDMKLSDPAKLSYYGCFDSWGTYEIGEKLLPELMAQFAFIVKMDRRFLPCLYNLEEVVQNIDLNHLEEALKDIQGELEATKKEFYESYGYINPNSKKAVRELLVKLGYNTGVMTKGGKNTEPAMSVAMKALENLGPDCHVAILLTKWAKLTKLYSSYFLPLKEREELGLPVRIHYVNKNAATYRLSCGGYRNKEKGMKNKGHFLALNLQSAPKPSTILRRFDFDFNTWTTNFNEQGKYCAETGDPRMSFRKCFVPKEGHIIVSMDFSSQELVIIAELSREPAWYEAIKNGDDLHMATARMVWGDSAGPKERKLAKTFNYAMNYGGTAYTLASKLKIPLGQADIYLRDYNKGLRTLTAWKAKQMMHGRRYGYIQNLYGIPRHVYNYYRMGRKYAAYADRTCLNHPVQSVGGVMIRLSLIKVEHLLNEKYKGLGVLISTIHDELNIDLNKDDTALALAVIKDAKAAMESTWPKTCELRIEAGVSIGPTWGELLPIELDESPEGFHFVEKWPKEDTPVVKAAILGGEFDVDADEESDDLSELDDLEAEVISSVAVNDLQKGATVQSLFGMDL